MCFHMFSEDQLICFKTELGNHGWPLSTIRLNCYLIFEPKHEWMKAQSLVMCVFLCVIKKI